MSVWRLHSTWGDVGGVRDRYWGERGHVNKHAPAPPFKPEKEEEEEEAEVVRRGVEKKKKKNSPSV